MILCAALKEQLDELEDNFVDCPNLIFSGPNLAEHGLNAVDAGPELDRIVARNRRNLGRFRPSWGRVANFCQRSPMIGQI